jgi:hypothetical protein
MQVAATLATPFAEEEMKFVTRCGTLIILVVIISLDVW